MDPPEGTVAQEGSPKPSCGSPRATTGCRSKHCDTTSRPPGLHYLLIHYDVPAVDAAAFRLEIGGAVERPLDLSSTSCGGASGWSCR